MSWTVTVNKDEDKPDVGSVDLVFIDIDSSVFSYSQRARLNIGGRNKITVDAIAARNVWRLNKTKGTNLASNLQTYINENDK